MKTTYHMPSAMKALCNRVIEAQLNNTEIHPSDLEREALRWAYPLAKRAGNANGPEMFWFHKEKNQWITFVAMPNRGVKSYLVGPYRPNSPNEVDVLVTKAPKDCQLQLEAAQ